MKTTAPIGFFDSGLGGITIWNEVHRLLPMENTIYLADSKNAPYGTKSREEITALSVKNTEFLLSKNVKLIVVACNTATTNAIKHLRTTYNVPFIGIEPAIKPAAIESKTGVIGVLATRGTLSSDLFHEAVNHHSHIKIIDQIGYDLVSLIENGKKDSDEIKKLLKEYLQPMIKQNIDHLVLGCTHYPFLKEHIQNIIPPYIKIIDSGKAVARQTKKILSDHNLLNISSDKATNEFYINKDASVLKEILADTYPVFEVDF